MFIVSELSSGIYSTDTAQLQKLLINPKGKPSPTKETQYSLS